MPITNPSQIAVLADAHTNWPALQAVLDDLKSNKIKEIWYLGDFIGYGPYPVQVIRALRECSTKAIVGNYDLNVLRYPSKKKLWIRRKDPSKIYSYEWTFKQLKRSDKDYLAQLPQQETAEAFGQRFRMVHGSPEAIDEPLKKDTPKERFAQLARKVREDVVLCGHTHVYFSKKVGGKYFVNPGSVGRSFDGNQAASYVILQKSGAGIAVSHRRVSYEVAKVVSKMRREGFPEDICQSIETGRSLDDVKDTQYQTSADDAVLKEVIKLARSCDYEKEHSHQVTKLALRLFDELTELHQLGARHRLLLQSASLLHDIGWIKGRLRHHKTARDIILQSYNLPLTKEERLIVALVARYHRRSVPRRTHKYFADLTELQRNDLKKLAALLRVADGLDRRHMSAVRNVTCTQQKATVCLQIESDDFSDVEKEAALKKADLFREIFRKEIVLQWTP
ncbi:MAG: YfcE family phosphodiesterase [Candidatus Omnitrophica bacterium]|nr:YfcE family phosphodiesterase [Candidatus Omnitrophota bacterium]